MFENGHLVTVGFLFAITVIQQYFLFRSGRIIRHVVSCNHEIASVNSIIMQTNRLLSAECVYASKKYYDEQDDLIRVQAIKDQMECIEREFKQSHPEYFKLIKGGE